MMKKDNTLTKIDNYFDNKKPSEVSVMLLASLILSGVVIYYAIMPYAQEYHDSSMSENSSVTTNLNEVNNKLDSLSLNNDRNNTQKMNQYFDDKLKELSYLIFSEQSWADFLDNLALLANKNNVKITKISNTFKEPSAEKIEQMLDINISVDGGFKDIVGYINAIEESKLVVDVNGIDINSTNGKLKGNMGIYIWGMKYQ